MKTLDLTHLANVVIIIATLALKTSGLLSPDDALFVLSFAGIAAGGVALRRDTKAGASSGVRPGE